MELGPKKTIMGMVFWDLTSIMVVYMDPLGFISGFDSIPYTPRLQRSVGRERIEPSGGLTVWGPGVRFRGWIANPAPALSPKPPSP